MSVLLPRVAGMMTEHREPLVCLQELAVEPEAPRPDLRAGDEQRPGAAGIREHGVLVERRSIPNASAAHMIIPVGQVIGVAALEHDGTEPPWMIVERAFVVRPDPVMQ